MPREFGFLDLSMRLVAGLLIVLGSYNPYAMSYYHWIVETDGSASLKALAGLTLVTLHVVFVLASVRSLGPVGIGLLTALFGSMAWVLVDQRWLDIESPRVFVLTLLLILGGVYGAGISWSHLRNRLSGQVDSTDITLTSPL
ncbi:DUF6524 family protein [Arenibaculum sp.]|uniref:DUF6524 family protein n=1 Tax=Arenibaculum sp. TaxID=2865862 RepID=UPI002E115840|nr:DUF6524 family protein [Arenibaculum sp.]